MTLTTQEKGRIIRLSKQGWKDYEIAEMMDLPETLVRDFIRSIIFEQA